MCEVWDMNKINIELFSYHFCFIMVDDIFPKETEFFKIEIKPSMCAGHMSYEVVKGTKQIIYSDVLTM